jgi:tRNA pseudouridine55 synthase
VEFAAEGEKEYVAGLELGKTTDTQDSTGTVLTETPCSVTRQDIEGVLDQFRGEILQVPPMYSALKVNGKRLYDLARKGKEVERKPRPITIYALELGEQLGENTWSLRVRCSKGTYIRTLCHDIGAALGVGGVMCSLRRTEAAGFTLAQAVTLEQVMAAAEAGKAQELLLPVEEYFQSYPKTTIAGEQERRCRNGNEFRCEIPDGTWRVYSGEGAFLMLGACQDGVMKTVKSFFEV